MMEGMELVEDTRPLVVGAGLKPAKPAMQESLSSDAVQTSRLAEIVDRLSELDGRIHGPQPAQEIGLTQSAMEGDQPSTGYAGALAQLRADRDVLLARAAELLRHIEATL